jgi:phasin family protein
MDSFPAAALPFAPIAALLEAQCKNAVALTSAHRVLVDGFTTLAQHQGALFRTTVDDCSRATGDVLAGASLEERNARQADAVRQVYVSTVDRLRELSDIAVRTNVAALDILNARVAEAFDDLTALFARPSMIDQPVAVTLEATPAENAATEPEEAIAEEASVEKEASVEIEAEPMPVPVPKPRPRPAKPGRRPSSRR